MDDISGGIVARKYRLDKCIGSGKFGNIYKGINTKTNEFVALKLEDKRASFKMLKRETAIMKYLYEHNCRNIPCVHWFGQIHESMCMVMPYYDCSLYEYGNLKTLSENKLDALMVQCIHILQSIHTNMVLHRDIKPQNFMVKNGELYLIDFGLATFYINDNKLHVPNVIGEFVTGTPKYISQHLHEGCTPSRRDEFISLGYLYIYMYAKELPWDSVFTDTNMSIHTNEIHIMHSKNQQRKQMKAAENIATICKRINMCIENYFRFCNAYDYFDEPMYNSLCSLFIDYKK